MFSECSQNHVKTQLPNELEKVKSFYLFLPRRYQGSSWRNLDAAFCVYLHLFFFCFFSPSSFLRVRIPPRSDFNMIILGKKMWKCLTQHKMVALVKSVPPHLVLASCLTPAHTRALWCCCFGVVLFVLVVWDANPPPVPSTKNVSRPCLSILSLVFFCNPAKGRTPKTL